MSETWHTGRAVSDIRVNPVSELYANTNWAEPVSDSPIVNPFQCSFSVLLLCVFVLLPGGAGASLSLVIDIMQY